MKNKCLVALIIIVLVALTSSVLILARAYANQSDRIDAIDTVYHRLTIRGLVNLWELYTDLANTIIEMELEEDKPIMEQETTILEEAAISDEGVVQGPIVHVVTRLNYTNAQLSILGLLSGQISHEVSRLNYVNVHLGKRQMQMPTELYRIHMDLSYKLWNEPLSLEQRQLLAETLKSTFGDIRSLIVDFQHKKDADSIRRYDQYIMEILSDLKPLLER
ncbi:hypothetical protein M1N79_01585 [Dehalococcoidia bacterium]|nr:hypothetical protein [Dehalococcoidia bacterium]